jgi:hypothetical protein
MATPDSESGIVWRKSTASADGSCVEVAFLGSEVLIRDSQHPQGPMLKVSIAAWIDFLAYARKPQHDL